LDPPLDPKVAKRLLDLLSTDDEFRTLFKRDAQAALEQVGFVAPAVKAGVAPTALPGVCMQLKPGEELASKEQIIRDRAKLESLTTQIMHFIDAPAFRAD